jgi:adhesin transport system membrane fusion protein
MKRPALGFVAKLPVARDAALRWLGWKAPLENSVAVPAQAYFIRRCAVVFGAIVLWAAVFPLEIASVCEGEIISASLVKKVQHLEGGIVDAVLVKDGEFVHKDQVLVTLQGVSSQADTRELEAHIGGLKIHILRLETLLSGERALHIPEALQRAYPEQARVAKELFAARREKLSVAVQGQGYRVEQRSGEIEENRSRINHLQSRRALLLEQIKINNKLRKEGLSSEYESLELQKELSSVEGQLAEAESAIKRLKATLDEEKSKKTSLSVNEAEEIKSNLNDARKELGELTERLAKFSDTSQRTQIRAPVEGVVMMVYVHSRGEVVSPGGIVLSMVPGNDTMLAEVKLPVSEIGFAKMGQPARLQLAATVSRGFAPISGKVVYISPDALTQENKPPYFTVRIATSERAFSNGAQKYQLTPGVSVSAAIITGRRTVLMYLLDPLFGSVRFALAER